MKQVMMKGKCWPISHTPLLRQKELLQAFARYKQKVGRKTEAGKLPNLAIIHQCQYYKWTSAIVNRGKEKKSLFCPEWCWWPFVSVLKASFRPSSFEEPSSVRLLSKKETVNSHMSYKWKYYCQMTNNRINGQNEAAGRNEQQESSRQIT